MIIVISYVLKKKKVYTFPGKKIDCGLKFFCFFKY